MLLHDEGPAQGYHHQNAQETAEEAESSASQVEDHLLNELQAADGGARTLATLLGQLHVHGARVERARLDQLVDAVTLGSDGWVAYVLDPSGTTIAASNRGRPDSFLGKNFAARPYFRTARAGRAGRYFGVGLVSGTPGYYASEPVTGAAGQVVAVAVVKRQLGSPQLGPKVVVETFIVSAEGRAVVASGDGGVSRLLWNAGPPPAIAASGEGQDPSTPLFDHPIQGTETVKVGADRLVAVRRPIPDSDWSLLVLKKERTQIANRILGIVITLLLCSVVLTYFVAMQRQLGAESQINDKRRDAEGRARDSARRADTDALTGLLNRLGFDAAYGKELERARRYGQPLSVVMLDLDHFKRVNDQHGHAAGDQVLVGAARLVETNVRDSDAIGRWGGEEFMVLAPATSAAGAIRLAEKLRALMAATIFGPAGPVTGSFGVAELRPGDTVESLLQRADAALYRAKSQGRNRVACDDADVAEVLAVVAAPSDPDAGPAPAAPLLDGTAIYAETGFPPMDLEHRALSDAISGFFAMLSTGKTEEVQVALESIIVGVGIHFDHEERLMEAHAFPGRALHVQQHVLFVAEAGLHLEGLVAAGVTVPFRRWVVGRLPEWFRLHILEYDVDLGRFLIGSGATDEPALPRRAAGR